MKITDYANESFDKQHIDQQKISTFTMTQKIDFIVTYARNFEQQQEYQQAGSCAAQQAVAFKVDDISSVMRYLDSRSQSYFTSTLKKLQ